MLQIQNTLVSLDLVERFFCCDLDKCKGQCCVDGDAGAPLTAGEERRLADELPHIEHLMTALALDQVKKQGVAYVDCEGDLVTTIINGRDCAFTCHEGDICLCALEKHARATGAPTAKPISCSLYPVRLKEYPTFTAVNYHRWDICRSAEENGRQKGIRVYEFLKEPLTRRFGQEWYEELEFTAKIYLEEQKQAGERFNCNK